MVLKVPQIGDRVQCVSRGSAFYEQTGTVEQVSSKTTFFPYGIRFDRDGLVWMDEKELVVIPKENDE